MANFDKALSTLEFNKILDMLADCAMTEGAKANAIIIKPTDDIDRIKKLQLYTTDAKRLVSIKSNPSFGFVKDINASVERAEKGAILSTRELLEIAGVLRTARILLDYLNNDKKFDTSLDEIFYRLTSNRFLEEKIKRAIIAEDMIADEASSELADIRRKMRNANNKIKDNLQKYVTGNTYNKYLQENIVTMRNGRYVIPIKSEYKNEIQGLVHDTSSSGATMFIEPLSVVEANNELRVLEGKEANEIERILAELSAECADISTVISLDYYNINELALIFAKSELSFKLDASEPHINDNQIIELYNARHPLLDSKNVVPINISLGKTYDTLVITGPNTGGKTVSLKTLGLFSLMTQAGLHIPASDRSSMCVFHDILADIGDEQSIEQSLSTFSSHMVNIVKITSNLNTKSLVLFDELGAGTDPIEGAALAVAILEKVREHKVLCAATTHYAELKAYALETKGVCNASCEFDVNTLRPTFKLIVGTPGRSNAFAISSRLGLDKSIVERAKCLISNDNKNFENVIDKLDQNRIEMEIQKNETTRLRHEYEAFKAEAENKLNQKIATTEKELEKSRVQAIRIVESAKASSNYIMDQLDEVKKLRESEKLADGLETARQNIRQHLKSSENDLNPVIERRAEDYILPRMLKTGDEVLLVNINKKGIVVDGPDKDDNVTVQAGIITTKTKLKNLILIEDDKVTFTDKDRKKTAISNYRTAVTKDFKMELDLRGMNGEEAWFLVDKYFDDAHIANIHSVTLIHGKGTGALKSALWRFLKNENRVVNFRLGLYGEGDLGVTVVELR